MPPKTKGGLPNDAAARFKLAARPTPGMAHRPGRQPGNLLEAMAREPWPTPTVQAESENWATPTASCHDMDTLERSHYAGQRLREMKQAGQPYQTKTSGMLSARWVCLLMALPPDYLNIPPLPGRAGRRVQAVHKKPTSRPG